MTTQEQLDVLRSELEQLQVQLRRTGKLNDLQVSALIVRTGRMLRESRGGKLESTLLSIHGLLERIQGNLRKEKEVVSG